MQLQLIKSDEPDLSLWFLEYIDGADVVFADSFAAFNFVGQLDLTRGDQLSNGSQMATVVAGFQVHLDIAGAVNRTLERATAEVGFPVSRELGALLIDPQLDGAEAEIVVVQFAFPITGNVGWWNLMFVR